MVIICNMVTRTPTAMAGFSVWILFVFLLFKLFFSCLAYNAHCCIFTTKPSCRLEKHPSHTRGMTPWCVLSMGWLKQMRQNVGSKRKVQKCCHHVVASCRWQRLKKHAVAFTIQFVKWTCLEKETNKHFVGALWSVWMKLPVDRLGHLFIESWWLCQ